MPRLAHRVTAVRIAAVLAAFMTAALPAPAAPPGTDDQLIEQLRALKPLRKVHYSWHFPSGLLRVGDPRLYEVVRITHAASLRGEWSTARDVEMAVLVCKAVNATQPAIAATLAINYSPWAPGRLGNEVSPKGDNQRLRQLHAREVSDYRARLERFKGWLADSNRRYETNIPVTALLLDCEQFRIRADDEAWNKALTAKYNQLYEISHEVFPGARVVWFGRGVRRVAYGNGWDTHRHFTFQERGDGFSCSLYRVPEIGYMRETFRRTYDLAKQHGEDEVTPWIALGSGWRRQADKFHEWSFDWDYDLVYSWQLGRELSHPAFGNNAERFAPWNAAKVVIFYPPPFDERVPAWGKHFVAYVRGAGGVPELAQE